MFPTKQAKKATVTKEPKLHQTTEWRKNPREEPGSVGSQRVNNVWLWSRQHYSTCQKSNWIRTFIEVGVNMPIWRWVYWESMPMAVVSMRPSHGWWG